MWRLLPVLFLIAGPCLAAEGPVEAHYETYAAGLNVVDVDARLDVTPDQYDVRLDYRTVGVFGFVLPSRQQATVQGRFVGARPEPSTFFTGGTVRGSQRVTQIDYDNGVPVIRQLAPPNTAEREVVPPAARLGTVDTLSAIAGLIRLVNTTGRCEDQARTYDGRRLAVLEARTDGRQMLPPTGRSSFSGPALRCDFVGRQLGGFKLDEDRDQLARPQQGTAWFAAVTPGGPMIPVRIAFHTRWFGQATMYLAPRGG